MVSVCCGIIFSVVVINMEGNDLQERVFIWLTGQGPPSREPRAKGTQGWNLKPGTEAEAVEGVCSFALFFMTCLLNLLPNTTKKYLSMGGTIGEGLGPPTSITNQEKFAQMYSQATQGEAIPQLRSLLPKSF